MRLFRRWKEMRQKRRKAKEKWIQDHTFIYDEKVKVFRAGEFFGRDIVKNKYYECYDNGGGSITEITYTIEFPDGERHSIRAKDLKKIE